MSEPHSDLPPGTAELLGTRGLPEPSVIARLEGGRNNRVFRLDFPGHGPLVLKQYFHDAADTRDRLAAEYAFLEAAAARAIACVARPIAGAPEHKLALYSLLPGRRMTAADATADAIDQALAFIAALNADTRAELPIASEACFSEAEHIATVERRIARLAAAVEQGAEPDCARFVASSLQPAWARIKAAAHERLEGLEAVLGRRLISPSDFGFHNALKAADGRIAFLDFEYAGWDTAAKLVGDAFNQVKVPLPMAFYPRFRDRIAALTESPREVAAACDALLPVYGIKWVTILLNEFIPVGAKRRDFAASQPSRALQLEAALAKLADVENRSLVA